MRLTRLTISGLKGQQATHEFTGAELLLGPNGVGKSARLNAVEILILGYAHRPDGQRYETMELASGDDLEVSGEFDVGEVINFRASRRFHRKKSGSITQIVTINGEEISTTDGERIIAERLGKVPVMFNPMEFLSKTPDKRREFLRPYLPAIGGDVLEEIVYGTYREVLTGEATDAVLSVIAEGKPFHELPKEQGLVVLDQLASMVQKKDQRAMDGISVVACVMHNCQNGAPEATLEKAHLRIKDEIKVAKRKVGDAEKTVKTLSAQKATAAATASGRPELETEIAKLKIDILNAERAKSAGAEKEKAHTERQERLSKLETKRAGLSSPVDLSGLEADLKAKNEALGKARTALTTALDEWKADQQSDFPEQKIGGFYLKSNADVLGALAQKISGIEVCIGSKEHYIVTPPLDLTCPGCGLALKPDTQKVQQEISALNIDLKTSKAEYKKLDDEGNKYVAGLCSKAEGIKGLRENLKTAKEEANTAADEFSKAVTSESEREGKLAEVEEEIFAIQKQDQADSGSNLEDLEAQIRGLNSSLQTKEADLKKKDLAQGILNQIEKSVLDAKLAEKSLEIWKMAEQGLKSVRNRLVDGLVKTITETANNLLRLIDPALSLAVILEDEEGNQVFDLRFTKDGATRNLSVLSGGETILAVSVALATALIAIVKPPLRILGIEAAETDGLNLESLLKGAKTMLDNGHLDNVLVASCAKVYDAQYLKELEGLPAEIKDILIRECAVVPGGWNVIRLGGAG